MSNRNKEKNIKKNCTPKKSGFTLVETLISILLFSLVAVMVSGVFATFLKNYSDVRRMQKNAESAQFAMNLMAKTIRTSNVQLAGNSLEVYDYAQGRCLVYSYDVNLGKIQISYSNDLNPKALIDCNFSSMGSVQDITSNDITGVYIDVVPSTSNTAGLVKMTFTVSENNQTSSPLRIQTAVSLRNLQSP